MIIPDLYLYHWLKAEAVLSLWQKDYICRNVWLVEEVTVFRAWEQVEQNLIFASEVCLVEVPAVRPVKFREDILAVLEFSRGLVLRQRFRAKLQIRLVQSRLVQSYRLSSFGGKMKFY